MSVVQIHYEEVGTGHPIILLHGWGVDIRRQWIDTGWVQALERIRRVVAIDSRGHGRSEKPHIQSIYSYASLAEDALSVMDELNIDRADVFGYSMGAFMAVWLLGHHPDRFSSVVMGGIGDETRDSEMVNHRIAAALREPDPAMITDPLGRAYRAFVDADPTNDREALALAALQMWPEGHPIELGGTGLGDVGVPVLIVNGEDDHPYIDSVTRLVDTIPGARLVTVPGSDHLTAIADPRLKAAVIGFLTG